MVCFQTKNPNLGKFWRILECKMLVYFVSIWSILRPWEIFYGRLVYFPPVLVCCTKKNLAALSYTRGRKVEHIYVEILF
jgi:hypothetical protein